MSTAHRVLGAFLALAVVLSIWKPAVEHAGRDNLHVLQADAFLHGRLDVAEYRHDVSVRDGRLYVAFPPAPALLLTPVVALVGPDRTRTVPIALALALLSLAVAWRILEHLDVDVEVRFWSILAFGLGTPLWYAVQRGWSVWYFSHVVAVAFLLLAIHAALVQGAPLQAGVFLSVAMLSRHLVVFAAPFLAVALLSSKEQNRKRPAPAVLLRFAFPVAAAGLGYLLLNQLRFGNPLDTGYGAIRLAGFLAERVKRYGLFSPAYLAFNLVHLLFQGFHMEFHGQTLLAAPTMDMFGTSLLGGSPFVLAILFAERSPRRTWWTLWTGAAVMAVIGLLYYNNGWRQINGQRFALDYWPLLLLPLASGLQRQFRAGQGRLWKALIGYAVALNVLALLLAGPLGWLLDAWPDLF